MTPLGILSTSLITPFVPVFSRNKEPQNWTFLRRDIARAVTATFVSTTFFAAVLLPLASAVIQLALERNAFDAEATKLVAEMFSVYITGGFFFVTREVLTRVFYVLGDASVPFKVAVVSVFANGALDSAFTRGFGFRFEFANATGIALSTVIATAVGCVLLTRALAQKIGFNLCSGASRGIAKEFAKSGVAGIVAFWVTKVARFFLCQTSAEGFGRQAFGLVSAAAFGGAAYLGAAVALGMENPLRGETLETR
jgi:putative peptidoglycan lipid II flippase